MITKRLSDQEKRKIISDSDTDFNLYAKKDAQPSSPGESFSFEASHKPGDDSDVDLLVCVGDCLFSLADMKSFVVEGIDYKDFGIAVTVKPKDVAYTGKILKDCPMIIVPGNRP